MPEHVHTDFFSGGWSLHGSRTSERCRPFHVGGCRQGTLKLLDILERAYRACLRYAQAQVVIGGLDCVVIVDATASPDLISPKQFDKFAKPFTRRGTYRPDHFYICGKSHPILTRMAEVTSGISIFERRYGRGQADCRARKPRVGDNVDVNTVLLFGEPEDVVLATRAVIDKGPDCSTTSCGISPVAPTKNLQTMVETGKKFGTKK